MNGIGGQEQAAARRVVFGVEVDRVGPVGTVERIMAWCRDGLEGGIVVTPNLDHVVKLPRNTALREAFAKARLVVVDGKPLVWLSRLDGGPALELVTGSDLVDPVCAAAARQGRSVFLFGTSAEVLETASARLTTRHPGLRMAGLYSPPMGFETSEEERRLALETIQAAAPDILFVALGSPKQEIWASEYAVATGAHAILCVGAALDFIAGAARRAPPAFRRAGAEWLWRVLNEPRRLGGRYGRILVALPALTIRHFADQRRRGRQAPGGDT